MQAESYSLVKNNTIANMNNASRDELSSRMAGSQVPAAKTPSINRKVTLDTGKGGYTLLDVTKQKRMDLFKSNFRADTSP